MEEVLAVLDDINRSRHRRRLRPVDARLRWRRQFDLTPQLERQDTTFADDVALLCRDAGGDAKRSAPAGDDRYVLFAVDLEGHGRSDHAGVHGRFPEQFAVARIVCGEIAIGAALEKEIRGRGQQTPVP